MNRAECDFCGLNQYDLIDEGDEDSVEMLFDVSEDGKQMACMGCSVGRDGFYQWTPDLS